MHVLRVLRKSCVACVVCVCCVSACVALRAAQVLCDVQVDVILCAGCNYLLPACRRVIHVQCCMDESIKLSRFNCISCKVVS